MCACVPASSTCQHACQRGSRANVPKVCQFLIFTCQFSTWRANMPKSVPIFNTFLLQNAKGNFYTLLLYKKIYFILNIIVIHIICIYISYIKTELYFISILHVIIKERYVEFLLFKTFLLFS